MKTLEETLSDLKEKIEGRMPAAQVNIMHEATRKLEASGIAERILRVGDKAPSFLLKNQEGQDVSSEALLQNEKLLVTFYRGLWCPYCNADLANLKRYTDTFKAGGIRLLSISPQLPQHNEAIVARQRLNFDLLSDPGNAVAAQFGLRWEMVDPLRSLYDNNFNIHLPEYNGDNSWTLPVPARFIINQNGEIEYAEYAIDYTKRPNPEVVLEAMKLA